MTPDASGARADRQAGEARRRVEVGDEPLQHLDRQSVEPRRRPNRDAEMRGLEASDHRVDFLDRGGGQSDGTPAEPRAQRRDYAWQFLGRCGDRFDLNAVELRLAALGADPHHAAASLAAAAAASCSKRDAQNRRPIGGEAGTDQ